MNTAGNWPWHFMPILMILGIVAVNHVVLHIRTEQRSAVEASRLRAALTSELRALQDIYQMNLELIENKQNYLISARSPVLVYKTNLVRLTSLLESPVIENLVSLFARNEFIEGVLAAHATSKGGVSYQLTPETKRDELKQMYAAGAEQITRVCYALSERALRSRSMPNIFAPPQASIRAPSIDQQPVNA